MPNLKPVEMNSDGFFVFVNPTNNSHYKVAVVDVINFLQPYINLVYDGDQTSRAGFANNDEFLVNINGAGTNQITLTALNYTMYMISGATYHSIIETNSSGLDTLANSTSSNVFSRGLLASSLSIVRQTKHTSAFSMTVTTGNAITNALLAADTVTRALILQTKTTLELDVTDLVNADYTKLYLDRTNFSLDSGPLGVSTTSISGAQNKLDFYSPQINLHIATSGIFSVEGVDVSWYINSDAGLSGQVLTSQGVGFAPIWKFPSSGYSASFGVPTWTAGTTLTILAATHGRGIGYHHVTVFDVLDNIVEYSAALTSINVNALTGDVVLTGVAFAGSILIS